LMGLSFSLVSLAAASCSLVLAEGWTGQGIQDGALT
jgi:hypothetical protein